MDKEKIIAVFMRVLECSWLLSLIIGMIFSYSWTSKVYYAGILILTILSLYCYIKFVFVASRAQNNFIMGKMFFVFSIGSFIRKDGWVSILIYVIIGIILLGMALYCYIKDKK